MAFRGIEIDAPGKVAALRAFREVGRAVAAPITCARRHSPDVRAGGDACEIPCYQG
ncbi:hypothetical protein ACQPXH_24765 [Nocardia sp. CA-135953]|uniref:hypothetical protein n=1 Tax=Nocardia sp. CA-135953 TaxID=3239978 RepID=UPI003D98EFB6